MEREISCNLILCDLKSITNISFDEERKYHLTVVANKIEQSESGLFIEEALKISCNRVRRCKYLYHTLLVDRN